MKTVSHRKLTLLAAVAGSTLLLSLGGTGCTKAQRIRANYTPYLDSTAYNSEQDRNRQARVIDHNTRGVWDDLNRVLLLDQPSRLSPYTIP
ncbi:hypothetical protein [Phycisphaera mikurensis]|uniref:Uncharacterized protein n=1 Tax=Phycisphaera mikurensis (strain NBRC 102666 / KCTC 22515 / FYK2301M01) TaxID=1142394 RepID=I0IFS1_PHYMF|nr:hypothetical protein [Phycisphaera mikurensis]MBB6440501.1 hypothetical protein [Phycisphaera mikurensis]BAM04109.1 hypothetical protein PSMK_19500 [Phycisphaera mikurensis NBRC 102666]